jgi:hypothetical protein
LKQGNFGVIRGSEWSYSLSVDLNQQMRRDRSRTAQPDFAMLEDNDVCMRMSGGRGQSETPLFRGAPHLLTALVACDHTLGCVRLTEVRWTTIEAPAYVCCQVDDRKRWVHRCLEIATRGSLHADHIDDLAPGGVNPLT